MTVEESIHVSFDEYNPKSLGRVIDGLADTLESTTLEEKKEDGKVKLEEPLQPQASHKPHEDLPKEWKISKNHPIDNILGDISKGVITRKALREVCNYMAFVSQIEPISIDEAINDEHWLIAMQDELNQFERNQVWELVPRPNDHQIIGTK
jgi:hypothetical protein